MRLNLLDEVAESGLRLCVGDLKQANFMKDSDGRLVAVDFGDYAFLPISFFVFALEVWPFSYRVGSLLGYLPNTTNVNAKLLRAASGFLVPFDSNNVGEQIFYGSLRFVFLPGS